MYEGSKKLSVFERRRPRSDVRDEKSLGEGVLRERRLREKSLGERDLKERRLREEEPGREGVQKKETGVEAARRKEAGRDMIE